MLQLFSIFAIFTLIVFVSFSEVNGELTVHDDDYIIEKFATGIDFPTTMDFIGNDLLVLTCQTMILLELILPMLTCQTRILLVLTLPMLILLMLNLKIQF